MQIYQGLSARHTAEASQKSANCCPSLIENSLFYRLDIKVKFHEVFKIDPYSIFSKTINKKFPERKPKIVCLIQLSVFC